MENFVSSFWSPPSIFARQLAPLFRSVLQQRQGQWIRLLSWLLREFRKLPCPSPRSTRAKNINVSQLGTLQSWYLEQQQECIVVLWTPVKSSRFPQKSHCVVVGQSDRVGQDVVGRWWWTVTTSDDGNRITLPSSCVPTAMISHLITHEKLCKAQGVERSWPSLVSLLR